MKKNLFLLGFMVCTLSMIGQTEEKGGWYFKLGSSYFMQTASTEFPTVGGQLPNRDVYVNGVLNSSETMTGSFGDGIRNGLGIGYRISPRLGVEMGINHYQSKSKTMLETIDRVVAAGPTFMTAKASGKITAYDVAPSLVLFLNEVKGFEPYTKVGIIVPVSGNLTIESDKTFSNKFGVTKAHSKDVILPNPTVGFLATVGTSYKLTNHFSAFAELEYRNFTVHGKTKETTVYTENGVDKLHTPTAFRPDASYSAIHANYVEKIDSSSNNHLTNPSGFDKTKATDDVSSYVGISGLGLTIGLKFSL